MKPYDFKELANELKDEGLTLAEVGAESVFAAVMRWVKKSAQASATPYDDMALLILPQLEEIAKKAIDKIDGKEG